MRCCPWFWSRSSDAFLTALRKNCIAVSYGVLVLVALGGGRPAQSLSMRSVSPTRGVGNPPSTGVLDRPSDKPSSAFLPDSDSPHRPYVRAEQIIPPSKIRLPLLTYRNPFAIVPPQAIVPLAPYRGHQGQEGLNLALSFLEQHHHRVARGIQHMSYFSDGRRTRTRLLNPTNETGTSELAQEIVALVDVPESHFVGPVSFGSPPQRFWLIFDTGSTNLEVVSRGCQVPSCVRVSRYSPVASSTFQVPPVNLQVDITFGTGHIHAKAGIDRVAVGPFAVANQTFGMIDEEAPARSDKTNIFDQMRFEGILGLGFPSLSSIGGEPFFDNLMRSSDHSINQFAIYMSRPPRRQHDKRSIPEENVSLMGSKNSRASRSDVFTSAFLLGGVDPRFYIPPIRYVPVLREHYWQVGLDGFWIGDYKICCDEDSTDNYIIFDSGTFFNTLPSQEFSLFQSLLPKRACHDTPADLWADYPTLTYKLTGGVTIELTPDMYMIAKSNGNCIPAYMQIDVPKKFGHTYILGAFGYMHHYFTVFRRGNLDTNEPSMVGIARARHSDEGWKFLEDLGQQHIL